MLRTGQPVNPQAQPLATILVKKTPFTDAEIEEFENWVRKVDLLEVPSAPGLRHSQF